MSNDSLGELDHIEHLPQPEKRKVALALMGVLAAGGLTLVPTKAKAADLGDIKDELDALGDLLGSILEILQKALIPNIGAVLPASVRAMIQLLEQLLRMTEASTITPDPQAPLEVSWPREPPAEDAAKREIARQRAADSRARVIQSMAMAGSVADQQMTMLVEEEAIATVAIADTGIPTKLNAIIALLQSLCARNGMGTTLTGAHQQLTMHTTAASAAALENSQTMLEQFLEMLRGGGGGGGEGGGNVPTALQ